MHVDLHALIQSYGYPLTFVGAAAEQMVGNLARVERELFLAVIIAALIVALYLKFRTRNEAARNATPPAPPSA